jgi:hypothetical protein
MKLFSKKRNATSYDTADNVSTHELEQMMLTAKDLKQKLAYWLEKQHSELVEAVK